MRGRSCELLALERSEEGLMCQPSRELIFWNFSAFCRVLYGWFRANFTDRLCRVQGDVIVGALIRPSTLFCRVCYVALYFVICI